MHTEKQVIKIYEKLMPGRGQHGIFFKLKINNLTGAWMITPEPWMITAEP
jgi:hypothetical protein